MKFSISERIGLLQILNPEGSFVTYGIINDFRKEVSFSSKEIKDYKIVEVSNGVGGMMINWDDKLEKPKEIQVGDVISSIIRKGLERLDREEKINSSTAPLYKRFVLSK